MSANYIIVPVSLDVKTRNHVYIYRILTQFQLLTRTSVQLAYIAEELSLSLGKPKNVSKPRGLSHITNTFMKRNLQSGGKVSVTCYEAIAEHVASITLPSPEGLQAYNPACTVRLLPCDFTDTPLAFLLYWARIYTPI